MTGLQKAEEGLFLCGCVCDSSSLKQPWGLRRAGVEEGRQTKLAVKSRRRRPFTRAAASYFSRNMSCGGGGGGGVGGAGRAQLLRAAFLPSRPPFVCHSRHV